VLYLNLEYAIISIKNSNKEVTMKKVLGLDIGSNSIGFSFLKLEDGKDIIFKEIISNSIVFSEPTSAKDRREARSSRRLHERKSIRNKKTRKIFVDFDIASNDFIDNTTKYLNDFKLGDVYEIRERAMQGDKLSKEEFILCSYSILTHRGYSNMFSISKEDGSINKAVLENKTKYLSNNYLLPSFVLTKKRNDLKDTYQNIPIRNKKDDYNNSLDREMHKEEFEKLTLSQKDNKNIFKSNKKCKEFIKKITNEKEVNSPFFQRTLKSFEDMVEYCSYYDKFNPKGSEKRIPLSNIKNIELTIRQSIDNYTCCDSNGEIKTFNKDEIATIVSFWINTPNANEITNKNIFKNAGFKNYKIDITQDKLIILNITSHRNILLVLDKYNIDFNDKDNTMYNEILLVLYYFKNQSSRYERIKKLTNNDKLSNELSLLESMDGFASFSLKFIKQVLNEMNNNKIHSKALEDLGYTTKYKDMPSYSFLPPLNPSLKDIQWLEKNINYFKKEHIFYQPIISPKAKKVISTLRKLINEIIAKYGKIDEIIIETAREMNSKKEQQNITENQSKNKAQNNKAKEFLLKNNIKPSNKNIQRAKLFKEQNCKCPYSGEPIALDEAFDGNKTEVEHFIPRSLIWIDSYKNKILVKKKYNQDKASQSPIIYLKSINQWDNFKNRINKSSIKPDKKYWLSDELNINTIMKKEHWQDSFLNDTRSSTKIISKYLNHYLYPKESIYGKGEKRSINAVSGRAINELKYMWGIHDIMPKNELEKKDRNTNYHHTIDAFSIALCSNKGALILHNHFKQNENKFKTKAEKENLALNPPKSKDGIGVVKYLQKIVNKYENDKLFVCQYHKRKTNIKGFKDGNLKIYITKDKNNNEILATMEKINIDKNILFKKEGLIEKRMSDNEVLKYIKSLQNRLDSIKQKNIIDSILIYAEKLISLRGKIESISKDIKAKDKKKTIKKDDIANQSINLEISKLKDEEKLLIEEQTNLKCFFMTKNNKKQIINTLRLRQVKIEKTKADIIISKNKMDRLSIDIFKNASKDKHPFVIKLNDGILNVKLFETSKGQKVGLNYFSSQKNPHIKTKINPKNNNLIKTNKGLILYKNDIIKVFDTKTNKKEYYLFNGGGDISGTNNKIIVKSINLIKSIEIVKNREPNLVGTMSITPKDTKIISLAKIDFFGNITEVKQNDS
jgi:CRISPR-associated endonuclease Csn1